jgi:hypothetical protein
MTLPASGTLAVSQVNVELGRASNAPFSFNDSAVRALAGVTGANTVSMSQLRGKSSWTVPTASPNNVSDFFPTNNGSGTYNAYPGVFLSGGSGNFSISWAIINYSDSSWNLLVNSGTSARVTHNYTRFGYSGWVVLRATITDNYNGYQFTCDVRVDADIYDPNNP